MLSRCLLILLVPPSWAAVMNSTDDWPTVDRLDLFQDLTPCAQPCVRDVNQQIAMGDTHCQSYGCVCAESTRGLNFMYGLSNVTECAKSSCPLENDVEAAEMAYQDICLVYAASSSRPNSTQGSNVTLITAEGYANLSSCAKFALNGCLNKDGTRDEANCAPLNSPQNWETYRGVAAQRQCEDSECVCKQPEFGSSFAVAFHAGERYCGMWLSTEGLPNEEYEKMQNILAMYCTSEGYPPKEWAVALVGQERGSNETNRDEDWTLGNRLQIGLGVGLGFPALLVSCLMLLLTWKQMKSAEAVDEST